MMIYFPHRHEDTIDKRVAEYSCPIDDGNIACHYYRRMLSHLRKLQSLTVAFRLILLPPSSFLDIITPSYFWMSRR